jgi:hypothetical protein
MVDAVEPSDLLGASGPGAAAATQSGMIRARANVDRGGWRLVGQPSADDEGIVHARMPERHPR